MSRSASPASPSSVAPSIVAAARDVRGRLLSRASVHRGLAGECALASMQLAEAVADVGVFRLGFFLRHKRLYGRRGRYPHPHAWCRFGSTIVDITATQFGRYPAIYVVSVGATDRYVERADGAQAIDVAMDEWLLHRLPEYRGLRSKLLALDGADRPNVDASAAQAP